MIVITLLFIIGFLLSAFFSGSETGFYRVARLRLVIDGLKGNRISKGLLWLANNPTLFVATSLVGNNIANYLTSLAIVLGANRVLGSNAFLAEIIAPIALSPLLFVYAELLPKQLFYQSPNYLLRRVGLVFLAFTILLSPISLLLWILGKLLEVIFGRPTNRVIVSMARNELRRVFREGEEAGVLRPVQRELAYNVVRAGPQFVGQFCRSPNRFSTVVAGVSIQDAKKQAAKSKASLLVVRAPDSQTPIGYIHLIELMMAKEDSLETFHPLAELHHREALGEAALRLRASGRALAKVIGPKGRIEGLISSKQLADPLLFGEMLELH